MEYVSIPDPGPGQALRKFFVQDGPKVNVFIHKLGSYDFW